MPTKAESLQVIFSAFEDAPPSTNEVIRGTAPGSSYILGMIDLHLCLFEYDGNKEQDDLRAEVWESIFPTPPKGLKELTIENGWSGEKVARMAEDWVTNYRSMITLDEYARNYADAAEREAERA